MASPDAKKLNADLLRAADASIVNIPAIVALLDAGADPNAKNARAESSLYIALLYDKSELAKVLLARPNIDVTGMLELWFLSGSHSVDVLHDLLRKTPNINELVTRNGVPILITVVERAIAKKMPWVIGDFMEETPEMDPNVRDPRERTSRYTPLMTAVRESAEHPVDSEILPDAVQFLLIYPDVEVDDRNSQGQTALHIAALVDHLSAAELLFEAEATANLEDSQNMTPLMYAVGSEMKELPIAFLEYPNTDVNYRNQKGDTALIEAIRQGKHSIAKRMLTIPGIDVGGALEVCLRRSEKFLPVLNKILAKIPDLNSALPGKKPILISAILQGLRLSKITPDSLFSTFFTTPGLDVNVVDDPDVGITALMVTMMNKTTYNPWLVDVLLTHPSIKVNLQDKQGFTALHYAAKDDNVKGVTALLDNGADPRIKALNGKTPFDLATDEEVQAALNEKLSPGEKVAVPMWKGFTKGDIDFFNDMLVDDETSRNTSMCPVCLNAVVRSEACMYMTHKCIPPHNTELYNTYRSTTNPPVIVWCTICGRICKGHTHYKRSTAEVHSTELLFVQGADPFANDCTPSGGGGLREKFSRIVRWLEVACELQPGEGKEPVPERVARQKLIREVWNAPSVKMLDEAAFNKIKADKKFPLPAGCDFANPPPAAAAAPEIVYPDIPRPEADKDLTPIKFEVGNGNDCYVEQGVSENGATYGFRHRQPDGTIRDHGEKGEKVCAEDLVGIIRADGPLETKGKCPLIYQCNAKLYPEEIKGIVPDEDYEWYKKFFNQANAPAVGGARDLMMVHLMDPSEVSCALPEKKTAGWKRRRTYRKKNPSKKTRANRK